jgi:hypothetical protein
LEKIKHRAGRATGDELTRDTPDDLPRGDDLDRILNAATGRAYPACGIGLLSHPGGDFWTDKQPSQQSAGERCRADRQLDYDLRDGGSQVLANLNRLRS